jgi:hypothetical protein
MTDHIYLSNDEIISSIKRKVTEALDIGIYYARFNLACNDQYFESPCYKQKHVVECLANRLANAAKARDFEPKTELESHFMYNVKVFVEKIDAINVLKNMLKRYDVLSVKGEELDEYRALNKAIGSLRVC